MDNICYLKISDICFNNFFKLLSTEVQVQVCDIDRLLSGRWVIYIISSPRYQAYDPLDFLPDPLPPCTLHSLKGLSMCCFSLCVDVSFHYSTNHNSKAKEST